MNPLYIQTPAQRSAVREQYLSSLQLQIENDQLNLNANKILKYTGETPTQVTDTRTTEEKFGDMISTRKDVKSFLVASGYLTPTNANIFVDKASDGIIQFIYRNKQFILRDYLSKDVPPRMFEDFIEAYVAKYQRNAGIEMGIQQASSGQAPTISNNQLLNRIITQRDLDAVLLLVQAVAERSAPTPMGQQLIATTRRLVADLRPRLPTEALLRRVDNLTPAQQGQIRVLLSDYFKDIPAPEQLRRKLQELDEAIQRRNIDRQFGVIEQINGLIAQRITDQQGLDEILRGIEGEETFDLDGEAERQDDRQEELPEAFVQRGSDEARKYFNMTDVEQEIGDNRAKITAFLYHTNLFDGVKQLSTGKELSRSEMRTKLTADEVKDDTNWRELVNIYVMDREIIGDAIMDRNYNDERGTFLTEEEEAQRGGVIGATANDTNPTGNSAVADAIEMAGEGAVKSRKDKFKKRVEFVGEKPKPYISFGKFYLNRHKLNDDILQIKGEGGQNTNFKTRRISPTLKSVLQSLLENKTPDFSLVSKLSDADKNNLHEAIQITKYDKITIDAPSKTADEKIANEFDVLRGSILGGNDSPTAIKRFKLLLVKLMNSKRIPRGEANDILFELAELGY